MFIYYGLPEEFSEESWYEYDNTLITNPYQSDITLKQIPAGGKKTEINKTFDVAEQVNNDEINNIDNPTNGNDTIGDSTSEGFGDGTGLGTDDSASLAAFKTSNDINETYNLTSHLEELPMFPGGEKARFNYFKKKITYPKFARENKIQGIVYVDFIVERDSTVSHIHILQGIGAGCDDEAIRAVSEMPKWIPGKKDGESIRVQVTMPLIFTLSSE
jgi:periplasmic protein TonB